MAASAIIISSDSSDESVGSPPSRVILFGDIPTVIPSTSVVAPETSTIAPVISSAAPMVETTLVASPTGLCGLVPYTGSDSDSPDEMTSPEHISPLPAISPFICTDSSEAPDSSDGPPSQDPYVATVARWRSRVTTRPSSSHEFPIAPIYSRRPGIVDGQRLLSDPRRLFLLVDLTAPILTGRIITHLLPVHLRILAIHSFGFGWRQIRLHGSSTIDVPPRLCYPPRRAPRRSEAFRHWCAAPLSTLYPPTTSESSSGDSSERPMHYLHIPTGPSGKRLIPGLDLAPLSMPDTRSITPTRTYLSPPRKGGGWRSVGKETIGGGVGGGGVGCQDDTEEYAAARQQLEYSRGMTIFRLENLKVSCYVDIERIVWLALVFKCPFYRGVSSDSYDRDDARVRLKEVGVVSWEATMTNTRSGMTHAAIEEMIDQRVNAALEAHQVNKNLELGNRNNKVKQKRKRDMGNLPPNGNCNGNENGNGKSERQGNGDKLVAHECTYQDFMKCQPTSFKGTEGVVGLIRWSEKMETVFYIRNCPEKYQVKYATCTLLDSALTWWNSHKRTIGTDLPYAFCPR
ncbi:hypothetical protein Tco_0923987 [Tanacetum coccineum]|uniref:Reverse transcriptase domain-containing protein n=1 Tax=Tanacetum coccineum TaxID=301880 RepID=A0ABQ5D5Q5_9ASTR